MGQGHRHRLHGCATNHHRGEYTDRQRADLDLVLAFNHCLAHAVAALDPDPLCTM